MEMEMIASCLIAGQMGGGGEKTGKPDEKTVENWVKVSLIQMKAEPVFSNYTFLSKSEIIQKWKNIQY